MAAAVILNGCAVNRPPQLSLPPTAQESLSPTNEESLSLIEKVCMIEKAFRLILSNYSCHSSLERNRSACSEKSADLALADRLADYFKTEPEVNHKTEGQSNKPNLRAIFDAAMCYDSNLCNRKAIEQYVLDTYEACNTEADASFALCRDTWNNTVERAYNKCILQVLPVLLYDYSSRKTP